MMNLNKKGWLKEYFEVKAKEFELSESREQRHRGQHPDQTLYSIIQPTGIMYGYPVKILENYKINDEQSRIKLILIDTLLNSYYYVVESGSGGTFRFEEIEKNVTEQIGNFYNAVYPEHAISQKNFFGKKREAFSIVEKTLDKRINTENSNFWRQFFHNSLLFLDVYFFRQWVQTKEDKLVGDLLKAQKDELRIEIVKVIAAAAHSNKNIEEEEKRLFEYFIESLNLPEEKKKEAIDYFEKGVSVNELEFLANHTWIMKKYFLELAILTTWADKKVEDIEMEFLIKFNEKLSFSDEEFEFSLLAIEGFVLEYWQELDKLQSRQDFDHLGEIYVERLEKLIHKNKDSLYTDIYKRGNLMKMINKAKSEDIGEKEKKYIVEQLINSIESLPSVDVIALPRKFLTLQVLMKVLPDDFFKNIN